MGPTARSRSGPARLQTGRNGKVAAADDGVPPELHAERNACVRQLARERDARKKLQAQLTQVKQQLAAANAELDRALAQSAKLGDPKAKLASIKDECAMLRDALLQRDAQLSLAADEYKALEQRAVALEGGQALHPTEAAKRTAVAKVAQQRIKSDKKSIDQLVRQEQSLADAVAELRTKLESATTPSTSPKKAAGEHTDHHDGDGGVDGGESVVAVQAEHERRRKAAIEALQHELARADRDLERRREALEAAEERRRQQAGSQFARAEQERAAALQDHTQTKSQLAAQTAKAESLRKGLATLTRDVQSAKEAEDRCEVERQALDRRARELQSEVDAALKKSLAQSAADEAGTEAWKREKAELESGVKVAERRAKSVEADLARVREEVKRLEAEIAGASTPKEDSAAAAGTSAEVAALTKAEDADNAAATALEDEAAAINAEAERIEARNALSQRDSIIEQQKTKLASLRAETKTGEQENADLRKRLEKKEALLAQHGLSVDA
uniref:Uncharacterized protein n=1 Tax=Neobodo designis TaxID=312471 RepID=A0A7S1Q0W1_NEODS|mmetsp:Transcript_282/g.1093  ORF Transcript_282/g.1093 Transcript_282/m.1093 type:complete len:503 (+) Transcript_282:90-1598(+)